jgi:hypothetical protein
MVEIMRYDSTEERRAYQALREFLKSIPPRGSQIGLTKGWVRYRKQEIKVHGRDSVTNLLAEKLLEELNINTWFLGPAFHAMKRVGIVTIEDLIEIDPRERRDGRGRRGRNFGARAQEFACILREVALVELERTKCI